jgi:HNH endonuclease
VNNEVKFKRGDLHPDKKLLFWCYGGRNQTKQRWVSINDFNDKKEKDRTKCAEWRKHNKEKHRHLSREWQINNPQKASDKSKRWRSKNRHRANEHLARRRERIYKSSTNIDKDSQKIICVLYEQSRRLSFCTKIKFHVDHIIPLVNGGKHFPENLQVITASMNARKWAK